MERSTDRLIDSVFEFQHRIVKALRGHLADWANVDLTMAQLKALVVLVDEGQCSIGQMAEALDVSLPNASHLVDKLVRTGFAQRTEDTSDRRRTLASATQQGVDIVRSMRQGGHDQVRSVLREIDRADLDALVQGLEAVVRALETDPDPRLASNATDTVDS